MTRKFLSALEYTGFVTAGMLAIATVIVLTYS